MKNKSLLLISYILVAYITMTSVVKAQDEATVFVDPYSYTVSELGQTFQIYINVTSVVDLWSWKIKLTWNASILEVIGDIEEGPFHPPSPTMFLGVPQAGQIPELSSTSMKAPKSGVTGSGTVAIITLNATMVGDTDITLSEVDFVDSNAVSISVTPVSGTVIVIPEFPASMIVPLFLIVTASIGIMAKTVRPKKPVRLHQRLIEPSRPSVCMHAAPCMWRDETKLSIKKGGKRVRIVKKSLVALLLIASAIFASFAALRFSARAQTDAANACMLTPSLMFARI